MANPAPAELLAQIHRERVYIYEVAAKVQLNPQRLSQMLNGKVPMPSAVVGRVVAGIERAKADLLAGK